MNRLLLILIVCTPFALLAQEYNSRWQQSTIIVDGHLNDWDERPGLYDSKSKLLYAMRNDSSNIYFCFEVDDKMMQGKIIHTGLKLSLSVKTKPKTTGVITFQAQADNSINKDNKDRKDDAGRKGPDEIKQSYKLMNPPILSSGFIHTNGLVMSGNENDSGLTFAIDWDKSNKMLIEIKIPLVELFHENMSIEEIADTRILMQVNIDAMTRPNRDRGEMSMSGMPGMSGQSGGGMGGPPSGGGGGQGGRGGQGGPPQGDMQGQEDIMGTAQKIKNKFTLTFE